MEILVIAAAVLGAGALAGLVIFLLIRAKVRNLSRNLFGNEDIIEAARQREIEVQTTPRSVSAVTGLMMPRIKKDFPEFDLEQAVARVETLIRAWLNALQSGSTSPLNDYTLGIIDAAEQIINTDKLESVRRSYTSTTIHRIEISGYSVSGKSKVITFQAAVGYCGGRLKDGQESVLKQVRFTVELANIHNEDAFEEGVASQNCPNCGAPIAGQQVCPYCGLGITELNTRAWRFISLRED